MWEMPAWMLWSFSIMVLETESSLHYTLGGRMFASNLASSIRYPILLFV